jgi:hypothetical protein
VLRVDVCNCVTSQLADQFHVFQVLSRYDFHLYLKHNKISGKMNICIYTYVFYMYIIPKMEVTIFWVENEDTQLLLC